jgi:hypothetical protein
VDGRKVSRPTSPADDPRFRSNARERIKDWVTLTKGELLVFIGIMIKVGIRPCSALSYNWTSTLKDPEIFNAMTQKR